MLSGQHETVDITSITVDRSGRIRKVIPEASILDKMDSIRRIGLIHAPVVTRERSLVAGETRLEACKRLGWTHIPIQYSDTLEPDELLAIELEENIKRTDLTWQEQCDALLKFHELKRRADPAWNSIQTGEAIGLDRRNVDKQLGVARALIAGDIRVTAAPKLTTAVGIVSRQRERAAADALAHLALIEPAAPVSAAPPSPIQQGDFNEWAPAYEGPTFNLLHCDFPYGIGAGEFNQGAGAAFGGYSDTFEDYTRLIDTLIENRDRLLGESAHVIFWYSMKHHQYTLERLQSAFRVDPYPLLWFKSDNVGILPDHTRGPRRVYEVAFFCSHGDRKIITPVANAFAAPTVRTGEHMSEKNADMLAHFFRMVVDDNTRMLDPTAGSGSALRAAQRLGAKSLTGLELNPEYVENARRALEASNANG